MAYDLRQMARASGLRRNVTVRDIRPPATLADSLYSDCYAPIVDLWSGAGERIAQEYARSLAGLTTDAPADLERDIARAASESNAVYLLLTTRLRDWAFRVERWHRNKWRAALLAASRVDVGTLLGAGAVKDTLDMVIARNAALIVDISDQARARISAAVFDGLRNRTPANEVARKIRSATGMARDRARRVASDQLAKLTSSLADERRREAGIDAWQWLHSGKRNPREAHKARDGKKYTDDPADVGSKVDGETLAKPPEDAPGQLPFCGCRSRAVLVLE